MILNLSGSVVFIFLKKDWEISGISPNLGNYAITHFSQRVSTLKAELHAAPYVFEWNYLSWLLNYLHVFIKSQIYEPCPSFEKK